MSIQKQVLRDFIFKGVRHHKGRTIELTNEQINAIPQDCLGDRPSTTKKTKPKTEAD